MFCTIRNFFRGFICLFTSCCHLVTRKTCLPLCHSGPTNVYSRLYAYLNQLMISVAVFSMVADAATAHCTDLWKYIVFEDLFPGIIFLITSFLEYLLARSTS